MGKNGKTDGQYDVNSIRRSLRSILNREESVNHLYARIVHQTMNIFSSLNIFRYQWGEGRGAFPILQYVTLNRESAGKAIPLQAWGLGLSVVHSQGAPALTAGVHPQADWRCVCGRESSHFQNGQFQEYIGIMVAYPPPPILPPTLGAALGYSRGSSAKGG